MASLLSPTSPLLPNLAMTIYLFPTSMGLFALLFPLTALTKAFQYPLPADPSARNVALSLTRLFGIRELFMGGAAFAAWWQGDREMMGYSDVAGSGRGGGGWVWGRGWLRGRGRSGSIGGLCLCLWGWGRRWLGGFEL